MLNLAYFLVEMELKTSGRCSSPLSATQCKNGPYPSSSYKWGDSHTWSANPKGCYFKVADSSVHYNKAVDGTDCTVERNCLCNKGEGVHVILTI